MFKLNPVLFKEKHKGIFDIHMHALWIYQDADFIHFDLELFIMKPVFRGLSVDFLPGMSHLMNQCRKNVPERPVKMGSVYVYVFQ